MIKVSTFCSGIGSPEQALKELGVEHEIVFACEKDKFARQTYLANFTPNIMFEDMTMVDMKSDIYSDICMAGIPCQAFSMAGKRLGELDPRGLLFYNFYDYVKNKQPKYFIIENVKGLLSINNGEIFDNWINLLSKSVNNQENLIIHPDSLKYNLHWTVLNSKNFGVPQNRERIFIVGIRNDLPNNYSFPKGEPLKLRLKDVLEPVVDKKYYLSDKVVKGLIVHAERNKNNGFGARFPDLDGIAYTVKIGGKGKDDLIQEPICVSMRGRNPKNPSDRTTGSPTEQRLEPNSQGITNTLTSVVKDNLIMIKEATKQGYDIAIEGDSINFSNPNSETRRGRIGKGIANVLDTQCNQGVVSGYRIRRLTEIECMRLQGFPDSYIKPCSSTQQYKQAGNSITVNVMKAILKNIINL